MWVVQGRGGSKRHGTPAALALVLLLALAAPANAATIWAVGNGAVQKPENAEVAGYIERQLPFDRFLYLGDVYETGTWEEFQTVYDPTYGRFKGVTSPAIGNHEWANRASGYDRYWGALAPQTDGGHWYSFDLAGWHFVILNTEEPVEPDSQQIRWLESDLARYDGSCTIAVTHRPRYSADGGSRTRYEPIWAALEGHAVAVLSGHDHNYQRLLPRRGLVQFVVGTGGQVLTDFDESSPWLAPGAWSETEHGALRMALGAAHLDFEFHTTRGDVRDRGSIACAPHSAPPQAPAEPPAGDAEPGQDGGAGATSASVEILTPRDGAAHSRRLRTFRGVAANAAGPVRLTLVRRKHGRCMRFDGERLKRARCATRKGLPAKGLARWRLVLGRGERLPAGKYRLSARVNGVGGRDASDSVRFRIRR